MLRYLVIALFSLLSFGAYAQAPAITELPPLSGDAIGPGYSAANGTLFIPSSASLVAVKLPLTLSYDMVMPSIGSGTQQFFGTGTTSTGIITQLNPSTAQDFMHLQGQIRPAAPLTTTACNVSGKLCWRNSAINDSTRHHFCYVFAPNHAWFYLDGIIRDEITSVGTFGSSTSLWSFFSSNVPTNTSVFDIRVFNKALTADECVYISRLNQVGLIPNSGSTNTDMAMNLPLNNCVVTGALYTCADTSGNSNNATNDKAPPVVVVTSPSPGTASGAVSMTATCTDPGGAGCTQVCYLLDNVYISSSCPTTAPYTFSWDSTKTLDKAHTITAVGTNIGGASGTSAGVAITTANSVSAKSVFVDSVAGLDTNNCLTTGTACKTLAHIQSAISLLGGDTLSLLHDDTFTISAAFKLCGPAAGCTQNFYPSGLDTLTVTTYGGGTCNPFSHTATGCATIQSNGTPFQGVQAINASNLIISNLAIFGSGANSLNFCNGEGTGLGLSAYATRASFNITFQNNWVKDWACDFAVNDGSGEAPITNYLIENNVASSTLISSIADDGIRAGNNSQGRIQGNEVFNIGGSASQGNCILVFNYPSPVGAPISTVQFNACHDYAYNNVNCGGPVGIYATNNDHVLYQFNESYRGYPKGYPPTLPTGACDNDGFDIDHGATFITLQYNYAHDNPLEAGIAVNTGPNAFAGGNPSWHDNVIRYNIMENNGAGFAGGGNPNPQGAGTNTFIYNNTIVGGANAGFLTYGYQTGFCWSYGTIDLVFANNLCIYNGPAATIQYINVIQGSPSQNTPTVYLNNDYFTLTGGVTEQWRFGLLFAGINYPSLSAYQTATIAAYGSPGLDVGSLNVDPKLIGTPSAPGTSCYSSGIPAGPQPCPAGLALGPTSPLITTGIDVTTITAAGRSPPANPSVDYFGRPVGPTNFSIGASSGQ